MVSVRFWALDGLMLGCQLEGEREGLGSVFLC